MCKMTSAIEWIELEIEFPPARSIGKPFHGGIHQSEINFDSSKCRSIYGLTELIHWDGWLSFGAGQIGKSNFFRFASLESNFDANNIIIVERFKVPNLWICWFTFIRSTNDWAKRQAIHKSVKIIFQDLPFGLDLSNVTANRKPTPNHIRNNWPKYELWNRSKFILKQPSIQSRIRKSEENQMKSVNAIDDRTQTGN